MSKVLKVLAIAAAFAMVPGLVNAVPQGSIHGNRVTLWEDTDSDGVLGSSGDLLLDQAITEENGSFSFAPLYTLVICGGNTLYDSRYTASCNPSVTGIINLWVDSNADEVADTVSATTSADCNGGFSIGAFRGTLGVAPTAAGGSVRGFVESEPAVGANEADQVEVPFGDGTGVVIEVWVVAG